MRLPVLILSAIVFAFSASPEAMSGEGQTVIPEGEVLLKKTFVHRVGGCLDEAVRKELDAMVPRLEAVGVGHIVKVEAFSHHGRNSEERTRNSLFLALEAQRYLRTKHGVKLDLYLAAAPENDPSDRDFVRIVTLPDDFKVVHVSKVDPRLH